VRAVDPPALYIGHDRAMTVVSNLPPNVEGGSARTYRWGRIAELAPGGRPAGLTRARRGLVVGISLFVASAGLAFFGIEWALLPALAGTAVVGVAGDLAGREKRPGVIRAPASDPEGEHNCLLVGHEERDNMWAAIVVGRRICETLPALAGMIEPRTAERLLANALYDLAKVLKRRQDLRGLEFELRQQPHLGLPADNPAVRKLLAQRDRVTQALSDLDADVRRRMAGLETAAVASDNFLREREISWVTSRADQTLASLVPADLPGAPDSGVELAEEVEAVLAAYRELSDRYGGGG
jgi:hypothetical protein